VIGNGAIVANTRGFPGNHDDGADRDFVGFQCPFGLRQSHAHVRCIYFDPVHCFCSILSERRFERHVAGVCKVCRHFCRPRQLFRASV
jgi:hypothetical protein